MMHLTKRKIDPRAKITAPDIMAPNPKSVDNEKWPAEPALGELVLSWEQVRILITQMKEELTGTLIVTKGMLKATRGQKFEDQTENLGETKKFGEAQGACAEEGRGGRREEYLRGIPIHGFRDGKQSSHGDFSLNYTISRTKVVFLGTTSVPLPTQLGKNQDWIEIRHSIQGMILLLLPTH
jgi:hypothetical protein